MQMVAKKYVDGSDTLCLTSRREATEALKSIETITVSGTRM